MPIPPGSPRFSIAWRRSASRASPCRPATPMSARRINNISSIARRPRPYSAQIFALGRGGKAWPFFQSKLFLDFLAGNRTYKCTPWGNPTRTVFGWQRPCYLLGEGYAARFQGADGGNQLGLAMAPAITRNAPTAWSIAASRRPPSKMPSTILCGLLAWPYAPFAREGPMAPDIPLDLQRPAELRLQPAGRAKTRGNQ